MSASLHARQNGQGGSAWLLRASMSCMVCLKAETGCTPAIALLYRAAQSLENAKLHRQWLPGAACGWRRCII